MNHGRATSPVGCLVFKTSEALTKCLVGSTPTSSANNFKAPLINSVMPQRSLWRTLARRAAKVKAGCP